MTRRRLFALLVAVALAPTAAGSAQAKTAEVPNPVVSAPVGEAGIWGHAQNDPFFSLAPYDYSVQEYLVSGVARAYWSPPGPYEPTQYTTRVLAITPNRRSHFNGVVIVEWLNTSTGRDLSGQWFQLHRSILEEGYAYLGVSAQPESVTSLIAWDPVRYGTLRHGGYPYMFDIFSQAIQSTRKPVGISPLGKLRPRHVIATGISQSAVRLDEYLDWGPADDADVIDGFLIERNVDTKAAYSGDHPPVINIATEESVRPVKETAGTNWRVWQVAGGAHVDHWFNSFWREQQRKNDVTHAKPVVGAEKAIDAEAGKYGQHPDVGGAVCGTTGNVYPSRYISRLALDQLRLWVARGIPAQVAPPLEFSTDVGPNGTTIARDEFGNARGGVRSPVVDVPIVTYLGNACGLSGLTVELPPGSLADRFPARADYVAALSASVEDAVAAGWLLPADGDDLLARAAGAAVPR